MKTYEQLLKENRAYERMFMNIESAILDFRRSQMNIQEEMETLEKTGWAQLMQTPQNIANLSDTPAGQQAVAPISTTPIPYLKEILSEEPSPVDEEPKSRRGRKPGSKNKPKVDTVQSIAEKVSQVAEEGGTLFPKFKEVNVGSMQKDNKDNSVYVQTSPVAPPNLAEKTQQFVKKNIKGTFVNVFAKG